MLFRSKHAETKITLESKKHTIAPRGFSNSGSVRMDNDNGSIGRSEPDKSRGGTSRRENSSVASWGDIEKQSNTTSNSSVVKHFGPLFEDYRQKKAEMKIELLGPAVYAPFSQVPIMKGTEMASPSQNSISRRALDFSGPVINLKPVGLMSNDFANSIIDESQSTKGEARPAPSESVQLKFKHPSPKRRIITSKND